MKNRYVIDGDVTTVFVKYKGKVVETVINTDDLEKLLKINATWHVHEKKLNNYIKTNRTHQGKRNNLYLHQVICVAEKPLVVDHINRNTLDNRKCNLRPTTRSVNCYNQESKRGNDRGISWDKLTNKWKAYIKISGKQKQLGRFSSIDDARAAVKIAFSAIIG